MGLNKEQQQGFIDVIKFINDPNQKFMHISGGAGTGKTYFISEIADSILRHKDLSCPLHTVSITATTNKAVAVIKDAMPHRAGDISTIYSYMNLRLSENFSDGTVSVVPTKAWEVHSCTLLIIDEASMINSKLYDYLLKGLDSSCKVIFVSDINQIAPIKEALSPIYQQNYPVSYLTQPVRNAGQPALMALCEQVKQTVISGVFTPIVEVPGVIDFVEGEELRGILEREYATENPFKRVLSYTNKRVVQYNEYIRTLRGYTNAYEVGEILSNNESAELPGKVRLYTDQLFEVVKIISKNAETTIVSNTVINTVTMLVKDIITNVTIEVTAFEVPSERRDVLKYYAGRKNWGSYFKFKNQYPDFRAIAASTTHKAQGSTYDSVVVDLADIGTCTNTEQTSRMQYVALSRPKTRIYIRGALPERYFNQ